MILKSVKIDGFLWKIKKSNKYFDRQSYKAMFITFLLNNLHKSLQIN